MLAGKQVKFIVRDEKIFLDKCAAFTALGRMYVIRCADYRKADRILVEENMDYKEHFLYEKTQTHDDKGIINKSKKSRRRRTHVSLEAYIILVLKVKDS